MNKSPYRVAVRSGFLTYERISSNKRVSKRARGEISVNQCCIPYNNLPSILFFLGCYCRNKGIVLYICK
jgi:hypothetical protein